MDHGGPPLGSPLFAVEKAVPPELRHHPDADRQARVERLGERLLVQDVPHADGQATARAHEELERRPILRPEGRGEEHEREQERPEAHRIRSGAGGG